MTDLRASERLTGWMWIAAIWFAAALFNASQTLLTMHAMGVGKAWLRPFLIVFACWLPWALVTPFIMALARGLPIARGNLLRTMSVHLATFAAISAAAECWSALLQVVFNPWRRSAPPKFGDVFSYLLLEQIVTFVIVYALIVAATFVMDSRERMARQNEELAKAQLAALRSQMDPHFMFNTLNSIASLVYEQRSDAAVQMIVGLSELLRRSSEDAHRVQVSLGEEVEYLKRYIDIQRIRFGDRLRASIDIPDELLSIQVPGLLLQPLVENAIKHGVSKRSLGGEIRVTGINSDGVLRLTVYNDGPWEPEDMALDPHGVGLGNLRTRLKILHGERSNLLLQPAEEGGVEVILTVPSRA